MKFATILLFVGAISAIKLTTHSKELEGEPITDEQVKQFKALSEKLGLDMTEDMMTGQTPEDVSNAIMGAALENGKTQEEIETAMGAWSFMILNLKEIWKRIKLFKLLLSE